MRRHRRRGKRYAQNTGKCQRGARTRSKQPREPSMSSTVTLPKHRPARHRHLQHRRQRPRLRRQPYWARRQSRHSWRQSSTSPTCIPPAPSETNPGESTGSISTKCRKMAQDRTSSRGTRARSSPPARASDHEGRAWRTCMGDRVATKRTRLVYRPCVCVQLLGAEQSQCARGEQNRSHSLRRPGRSVLLPSAPACNGRCRDHFFKCVHQRWRAVTDRWGARIPNVAMTAEATSWRALI